MLTLLGAICCSEIPPSSNTQISCLLRKLKNFPVAKGGITDFIKLCVCNTYKLPEMVTAVCATFHSSRKTSEKSAKILLVTTLFTNVSQNSWALVCTMCPKLPMIALGNLNFSLDYMMRIV